ncbi:MAG: glycosyltransferase [Candidatus Delongbacteria bacterium]|nr:glycosyltransferase [Candidatus Delongbacteria bacterium]MCG2760689.1 glycosyltransferase [Candidatus Delongbacteria bacterium]
MYIENFRKGLSRIKNDFFGVCKDNLPKVTIVIPARNEEKSISAAINSVLNQNYPDNLFDIIAVNDRSSDSTGSIMDNLSKIYHNLNIIHITEVSNNISPKKNAIMTAVRTTENEIIITTDGDCLHDKNWLRSMISPLLNSNENIGIVAGLTVFEKKYEDFFESLWQNMQNIDYISHSLIAAGSIGNGRAFTANGSNLLIKKSLYRKEANNFKTELASGDDFFIIQSAQESNYRLRFVFNRESIVKSAPVDGLQGLIEQRSRWASKASYSTDFVLYFAVNTFVFYLGLLTAFFLMIFNFIPAWIFTILFLMKFIPETIFLAYGFGKFGLDFKLRYYLLLQIFHIPFNLFVAVKGKYFGFEWKGVKYRL